MLYLKLRKEKGRRPPLYIPLTGLVSLSPHLVFFYSSVAGSSIYSVCCPSLNTKTGIISVAGCSSRILIPDQNLDFLPSRIPDPGVKKASDLGYRIRISN